ncbi:MAG: 5-oxoprolinase subunit PxpB [Winogradskyella sp.]
MEYELKFSRYNEYSILIEWPAVVDENILKNILLFKNHIQNKYAKQKVEIINAFNSILVVYGFTIDNINDEILQLESLSRNKTNIKNLKPKLWKIPVCYDNDFGIDMDEFSIKKNLSKEEIIQLHSEASYMIYFIGFLPGFLYLGGLNKKLHLDRKSTPNLNVEKGAVGIGGNQTGIYPQNSPGGWHIIGKTPLEFFNPKTNPPTRFSAGDIIEFSPISKSEYLDLKHRIDSGKYVLNPSIDA